MFYYAAALIKANHLGHVVPRWYGSRIFADCQQKLFPSEYDTGRRFLLVPFLAEQLRDRTANKDNHL